MTNLRVKIFASILLLVLFLMMGACSLQLARATAVKPEARTNAFGAVAYTENPYIYNVGAVTEGRIVEDEHLQVDINPLGTFQQYKETVQFCGDPREMFQGKRNPVVLTYARSAPRMVEGRGCHQLIRVDSLAGETR